jgi:hypothetical protein
MNLNHFNLKKVSRTQAMTVLHYLNSVISEIKETIFQTQHSFNRMQLQCDLIELSRLALRIMNRLTTLKPGKTLSLTITATNSLTLIKYQKMYEQKAPNDLDTANLVQLLASQIHQQFIDLSY